MSSVFKQARVRAAVEARTGQRTLTRPRISRLDPNARTLSLSALSPPPAPDDPSPPLPPAPPSPALPPALPPSALRRARSCCIRCSSMSVLPLPVKPGSAVPSDVSTGCGNMAVDAATSAGVGTGYGRCAPLSAQSPVTSATRPQNHTPYRHQRPLSPGHSLPSPPHRDMPRHLSMNLLLLTRRPARTRTCHARHVLVHVDRHLLLRFAHALQPVKIRLQMPGRCS